MKKLVIAAAAAALLSGCGSEGNGPAPEPAEQPEPAASSTDSGVAQCRRLADPSDDKPGVPTEAEFAAARAAWEGSRHDELKKAGLGHLAAVEEFYEGSDNTGEVMLRRALLEETCSKYGVVFQPPTLDVSAPAAEPSGD